MLSDLSNDKIKSNLAKLEHQLKQEKTPNKACQLQIKDYKQKIIDLGVDPTNFELVKNLLKEKEVEIQVLKKNSKFQKVIIFKFLN